MKKNQILSIHQPSYFPWLGLIQKINISDTYIYMDEVQLADRAYQHRNLFLSNTGKEKYLTVNISKKLYRKKKIKELTISNEKWNKEHYNFLKENYKKHTFFDEVFPEVELFLQKDYTYLNDVLFDSMMLIFKMLNISTTVVKMSEMDYDREKYKSDLIFELIQRSGYNTYLSGLGAKGYMDIYEYNKQGINVIFQEFEHPVYQQKNNNGKFVQGLSILDMLFNIGKEETESVIKHL